MHDPLTVVCHVPNPFASRHSWGKRWRDRPTLVTVWHKDAERNGSDSSCCERRSSERERRVWAAARRIDQIAGNRPHFDSVRTEIAAHRLEEFTHAELYGSDLHLRSSELHRALHELTAPSRMRRYAYRWHVWHWRLQIHPWQSIKRVVFDRCAACRKGFTGRESVMGEWSGRRIWHDRCYPRAHTSADIVESGTQGTPCPPTPNS